MAKRFFLCLFLAGCSSAPPLSTPVSSTPVQRVENFLDERELKRLVAEVEQQAGKPFRFLELRATRSSFELQIQDPSKPENADSYQCRSDTSLRKVPLRTSGASAQVLTQSSMPMGDLKIEALPKLLQAAEKQAKDLEGRQEPNILINRGMKGEPEWNLYVSGSRKTVHVRASLDGKILSVEKN